MKYGITFVVTTYNNAKQTVETIESIQRCHFKFNYEIIVVDDASDDTLYLKSTVKKYLNIVLLIKEKNEGVQNCRNMGVRNASYDYIMMIDGDDKLNSELIRQHPEYYEDALQKLSEDDNIAFIHNYSKMFGDFSGLTISSYPLTEKLIVNKHHVPTSIIFRKNDIIDQDPYSKKIEKWQDWSFGVKLINSRFKVGKKNEVLTLSFPLHLYRIHDAPRISNKNISEYNMTLLTVKENPEIFFQYYHTNNINMIAQQLVDKKPSRLQELIQVAKADDDLAYSIVAERTAFLGQKLSNIP